MPVETVGQGIIHICGRWLVRLLVEFVFEIVCYALGFAFLRLITFGTYPPAGKESFSDGFVSIIGALILFAPGFWLIQ